MGVPSMFGAGSHRRDLRAFPHTCSVMTRDDSRGDGMSDIFRGWPGWQRMSCGLLLPLVLAHTLGAAEKVSVKVNGQALECEVAKVTKDGAELNAGGRTMTVPLDKLDPKDVARCYKAAPPPASATVRLDMAAYFLKHLLLAEAEDEANAAVQADPACKAKAAPLLAAISGLKEITGKKDSTETKPDGEGKSEDGEGMPASLDFAKSFAKKDVPPRTPEQMKAFLDKRLEELKPIGGTWRLKETKHFYCFANVPEAKHAVISQWDEGLYERLCQVLRHKEGDKLWNNKMPIYFFSTYAQFQRFAVEIDQSPGAGRSGGYFAAEGREVHACIPFMAERFGTNEKAADRAACNVLHHECTHAFLQLSGENVPLHRWLHEGLAQFIEFWYDREYNQDMRENNPQKRNRVMCLQQIMARGQMPSWAQMQDRPLGGMDVVGYSFAWSKLEFLYRIFDNQRLPQMIRLIKAGKTEEEAIAAAFGYPSVKLEEVYGTWLKAQAKTGFKFGQ